MPTPITGCFHDKNNNLLRKLFDWIVVSCLNIAGGNVLYFPLPGPNRSQNLTPKCKIFNVFWTKIASKKRTEQLNFFSWLSNVKNRVPSNGSEYVRNVIQ